LKHTMRDLARAIRKTGGRAVGRVRTRMDSRP
jgi:hypothetical protein